MNPYPKNDLKKFLILFLKCQLWAFQKQKFPQKGIFKWQGVNRIRQINEHLMDSFIDTDKTVVN